MKPRLKSSAAARELIKAHEPFVARATRRGRRWVVGYGHTASAREGVTLKPEDAELLLLYDVLQAERAIDDAVGEGVSGTMRDALVSFACSIGPQAFRSSDVALHARNARHRQAAAAIETWVRAEEDGRLVVSERLVRRRAAEKALYLQGVAAASPASAPPAPLASPAPETASQPEPAPAPAPDPAEPDAPAPGAPANEQTLVELDLIFETPERPAPAAPPKSLPAGPAPEPVVEPAGAVDEPSPAAAPAAPLVEVDLDAPEPHPEPSPEAEVEPDAVPADAHVPEDAETAQTESPVVLAPVTEPAPEPEALPEPELEPRDAGEADDADPAADAAMTADALSEPAEEPEPETAPEPEAEAQPPIGDDDLQPAPVDTSAQDEAVRRVMAQMAAAMGEGARAAPASKAEIETGAETQTEADAQPADAPAEATEEVAAPADEETSDADTAPEAPDSPEPAPARPENGAPVQLGYNFLKPARVAARPLSSAPAAIAGSAPAPAEAPSEPQRSAGVSGEAQGPVITPEEERSHPPVRKVPSIARRTPPHPAEGPAEAAGVSGEVGGVGRPEEFEAEDAEIHANDALDPFLVAGAEAEHGFKAEEEKPVERTGGDWVFGAYLAVGVALAGVGGWDLASNLEVYREEGFIYFGPLAFAAGLVLSLASLWFIIGRMFSGGNGAQRG